MIEILMNFLNKFLPQEGNKRMIAVGVLSLVLFFTAWHMLSFIFHHIIGLVEFAVFLGILFCAGLAIVSKFLTKENVQEKNSQKNIDLFSNSVNLPFNVIKKEHVER